VSTPGTTIQTRVASPLRSYTDGRALVEASGATVREVLADLERRYPGMRFRMIDEQDRIRTHIRLYVNTTAVESLEQPVQRGDTLHLICALSGG
jgi:molybdopterin converting factor small subunit